MPHLGARPDIETGPDQTKDDVVELLADGADRHLPRRQLGVGHRGQCAFEDLEHAVKRAGTVDVAADDLGAEEGLGGVGVGLPLGIRRLGNVEEPVHKIGDAHLRVEQAYSS